MGVIRKARPGEGDDWERILRKMSVSELQSTASYLIKWINQDSVTCSNDYLKLNRHSLTQVTDELARRINWEDYDVSS